MLTSGSRLVSCFISYILRYYFSQLLQSNIMLDYQEQIMRSLKTRLFTLFTFIFNQKISEKTHLIKVQHSYSNQLMNQSNYNPNGTHELQHYHGKCVCQICSCNQHHRCPEPTYPLESQTTHRFFYTPHQVSSFSPRKKSQVQKSPAKNSYDAEDLKTNYQIQYKPHKINPNEGRPVTSKTEYRPSPFKFEGQSEYQNRYSPYKVNNDMPRRYSPTKKQYVPSPHKLQGTTTYNHDYIPKKLVQDSLPSPKKKLQYSPSKTPLETETTYGKFYKPHKIEPYSPSPEAKKRNAYVPSPEKFEGQTRYREFYRPMEIKPRERCPTEYMPQRPYRCSPGKKHTHYNSTINRWE